MKKLVQINVVCNGSTGKIMCDIAKASEKKGYKSYCFFGRGKVNKEVNCFKVGNNFSVYFHYFLSKIGFNGHGSYFATKKMIRKIKKINPDIIHLHNIHGYYLNLKILFNYLKNDYHGKIIWTLHDCWAFTGHCAYFSAIKCNKWKKKCDNCPQLNVYPKEIFDTTKKEYYYKKKLFSELDNMVLITPSQWLKNLVLKSFLKKYNVFVVNNGVDLSIFKSTYDEKIYSKYNINKNDKIILGVANVWEKRKGLDVFLDLSKVLSHDEKIILVGLDDNQIKCLPKNIIGIKKTENQNELASLYSIASVFINPSQEESFSMVTAEALACHTPVVVCDLTAPKELINGECGEVVKGTNYMDYYKAYKKILNKKNGNYNKFDKETMINKIIEIYED